jgi:transcriptional regulator with XRE-family HTH domain
VIRKNLVVKMLTDTRQPPAASHLFLFEQEPQLDYSPEGIKRLSTLIRATLQIRQWSTRRFAEEASIAPSTASKYINGKVRKPEERILKAIAPLVYRVVAFTSKVYINTNSTYSDWLELARVATEDFEVNQGCCMTLKEMIESAIKKNDLLESQIKAELLKMQAEETASMTFHRFQQIQNGLVNDTTEDELRQIRVLLDLDEQAYSENEWILAFLESQSEENPTTKQQQGCQINELNGTK